MKLWHLFLVFILKWQCYVPSLSLKITSVLISHGRFKIFFVVFFLGLWQTNLDLFAFWFKVRIFCFLSSVRELFLLGNIGSFHSVDEKHPLPTLTKLPNIEIQIVFFFIQLPNTFIIFTQLISNSSMKLLLQDLPIRATHKAHFSVSVVS